MTGSFICVTYHNELIIEWKLEIVNIVSHRKLIIQKLLRKRAIFGHNPP